jgi:CheY-like chemotaxis protein
MTGNGTDGARPLSILVVDDLRDAADSLAELLALAGHRARAVYGGVDAIGEAAADPPDVVLLDLGMPRVDGFEVATWLRQMSPTPLLVAVTGRPPDSVADRCREVGFDFLLTKPVHPTTLHALLCQGRRFDATAHGALAFT